MLVGVQGSTLVRSGVGSQEQAEIHTWVSWWLLDLSLWVGCWVITVYYHCIRTGLLSTYIHTRTPQREDMTYIHAPSIISYLYI